MERATAERTETKARPGGKVDGGEAERTLVGYRTEGPVAILELGDPPANTYTHEMMRQLDEAVLRARMDDAAQVIVLRGMGDKFFCAGANISMLQSVTPRFKYYFCLHANETLNRLEQTPKLVIAALNGHTVGGGMEIALACDLRFASETCAGRIVPRSLSRPRCQARSCALVISVSMSASLAWVSWKAPIGRPNWIRSRLYRAASS